MTVASPKAAYVLQITQEQFILASRSLHLQRGGCGAVYPVGLYGWRKRCIYFFLLLLLATMIVNLALTVWIIKVMNFSLVSTARVSRAPPGHPGCQVGRGKYENRRAGASSAPAEGAPKGDVFSGRADPLRERSRAPLREGSLEGALEDLLEGALEHSLRGAARPENTSLPLCLLWV